MATKPFYGDPAANAPVWSKYAVLLGSTSATTPSGNADFTLNDLPSVTTQWDPVGALDSDNPFDNGEETVDQTDHSAAGFGVYATTFKNAKEVVTFIAKETTLVTLGILYDASGVTDNGTAISGTLKRRDFTKRYKVGFHRENGTHIERRISKNYATIDSITRSADNDESLYTVALLIVPTEENELFDYYLGPKADESSSSSSSSSS